MLEEYLRKRNFQKTPEPTEGSGYKSVYIIQKHDARRLHYDFRMELDGVLKSWAVPKGLSLDPSDKRLAIMTEDHPLDYADFEGRIPKGQYGAGTVEIWDRGKYVNITRKEGKVVPLPFAIEIGHFKVYLKGEQLTGAYAFTRLEDSNWIVVRERDKAQYEPEISLDGRKIQLTNLDKELDAGIRKGDYIEYCKKIASLMLPHIKDRPITLYRFPDCVHGKRFFQKDVPSYFPDWMPCHKIMHKEKQVCYAIVKDEAGIVYLANQVGEFHIMANKEDSLPDKMIFDLDPSKEDLALLKTMAKRLRKLLIGIGFAPFIMTTGGKGYHIVVPVKPELRNSELRDFALKISRVLAEWDQEHVTTELIKSKRKERIFVDVNRISPMQTSIAPYSVRARPGLPVAAPFDWEVLANVDPLFFSIRNYPLSDAWRDFHKKAVSTKKVIKSLEGNI